MIRIVVSEAVRRDLERIADRLRAYEVENIDAHLTAIRSSLRILRHSPGMGRPVTSGNRELIIGRRTRGYLALYRYDEDSEQVLVLRIRAQREAVIQTDFTPRRERTLQDR